jgi:tetratricopeptide (TPR) repeat protein
MRCMMAVLLLSVVSHFASARPQNAGPGAPSKAPTPDTVLAWIFDPDEQRPPGASAATINVALLEMPEKARKELARAKAALHSGDTLAAAQDLEKVVAIDPASAFARNILGVMYVNSKQLDKALAAFEAALSLNPNYHLAADNIAVVLCLQHHWIDAEAAARRALAIQPDSRASQYLLGGILVNEGHNLEEAVELLNRVKDKYARARLFLAQVDMAQGRTQQATDELQQYLDCPSALEREVAQSLLTQLQNQEAQKVREPSPNGGGQL